MPDHKEMGREPTPRERETAFAPHKGPAPEQQGDGDPGNEKRPRLEHEQTPEETGDSTTTDTAGKRGQWDK